MITYKSNVVLSYRNVHEYLANDLRDMFYGTLPVDKQPKLTLLYKHIDNTTHYRFKIDFVDADDMFKTTKFPIEMITSVLMHNLSRHTGILYDSHQLYWDYDPKAMCVNSISFTIIPFKGYDHDDPYVDLTGFVDAI